MNVSDLISALSSKIDTFLTTADEPIQNSLAAFSEETFNYSTIPIDVWETLPQKIKQAMIVFTAYHSEEEIQNDTFDSNYSIQNMTLQSLDEISNFRIIPNNNNPIFLIHELLNIKDFNKQTILYFAKALLDNWDSINYIPNHVTIFIPGCTQTISPSELIPFLKLLIIADGDKFHNHINASQTSFLDPLIRSSISCPTKNFDQYNDSIYILSEYNHANDLLQKYLLLYTVLENFMYRKPIADLLRRSNGFTIRNFKDLYKKVEKNEQDVLSKLYNDVKAHNIFTGQTIEQYIDFKYNNFKTSNTSYQVNFFDEIPFNTTNIKQDFPNLIYKIRNSIVHNKETEFHLTHLKLDSIIESQNCIQEFLLPVMENIIYSILLDPVSSLDYRYPNISLYTS